MQILFPPPSSLIGPGTQVLVQTDFVGPLPLGSKFEISVTTAPDERLIGFGSVVTQEPLTNVWIGVLRDQAGVFSSNQLPEVGWPVLPQPVTATVRLLDPALAVLDQGSSSLLWQPTAQGVGWIQQETSLSSPITGGFTETDRLTLESTNASVLSAIPLTVPAGGTVQLGVDQLLRGPPIDFLSEGENLLLSGRGAIARTVGGAGVYAYGGRWSIEESPSGLGRLDGQAILYEQRITQFVVVKNRLGGGQYAFAIEDSHYDSGEISWPIPFPVRIDFDILPGVTVRWRWLLFLQ